ncbi:phage tail tape measure protein, TP901 family, core region [Ralstonia sp. 25mfcol4.1]|uniref:phage tail tape measure protein n=1 Tax=Ralstonia sp. 25mfcol4.1 TaxID=1761899 RepID=UPI00088F24DD|nr:phage tail tape measure protein [Ralstonia sp. 25mfcol4.1]SDP45971.1 phage tail tape measure protein, TP901 family, core region [Ralstonia sp. 25mfcol4.1]
MSTPRNLRLEVVLQAVDRMTRPFRAIMGSSTDLAKAVKATRDQLKDLNRAQANIDSFRKLSKDAAITENQLGATQARVKALAQEIAAADKPTAAMSRAFQTAVREAQALKQRGGELQQNLAAVRGRLDAAGISTTSLGQAQRDLRNRIDNTSQALAQQQAQLRAVGERHRLMAAAQSQYQKGMAARNAMLNAGASMAAAGGIVLTPIAKAVKDYVTFEDAMLGIARQVDGARDPSGKLTDIYYDMARQIRQLGKELPIPTAQIAEMVTAGARMEVPRNELIEYTRTVAMMATAFDAVPDEIAESMGKVAKNFRIPTNAIMGLADTINYLDDNAISKGNDIINVLNRISGVVSGVAMPAKDAAALASTLLTLGERTETAGTAINAIVQKFAAAEKGTKKFHAAVSEIGLTTTEIQKGMATNATGTLFKVIEERKLPADKRIGVMVELVGMEHSDTLAKLVDKPDELKRQLDLANGSKAEGSMSREFSARQDTISARWQRLQNQIFNTSSAGGEVLRSTLVDLMNTVGRLVDRFNAFAQAHPQLVAWLIKGAAAVGVLLTVLGGLTLALAAAFGPMVIARYGMAMLGIQLGGGVGIVARLAGAFNFLMTVFSFVGRVFLLNPIGLAVTAIGVAAFLLIKYWDPIRNFFTGLWAQVTTAFQGGLGGILSLIANWSPMGAFYSMIAPVLRWFGFDLPEKFSEFGANLLQGLVNGITSRVGAVREAIVSVGDSVVGWFKEKLGIHSPSRVFADLGGYTMSGLEQGLAQNQRGPLDVVSKVASSMAGIGAGIAIGTGSAAAGISVDNRPPLSAASRTGAVATPVASTPVVININPPAGADEQLIARLVAERIERLEAQKNARGRSRLTDKD